MGMFPPPTPTPVFCCKMLLHHAKFIHLSRGERMSCDCAEVVAVLPFTFPVIGSVLFTMTAVLRLSPRNATKSTAG